MSVPSFDESRFAAFQAARQESPAIAARRQAAFETYRLSLATDLDPEEYRRLDLRALKPDNYEMPSAGPAVAASFTTMMQDRAEFAGAVVHSDGRAVSSKLDPELAAKGVLFGSLPELLKTHSDKLEPHLLTKAVNPQTDRFSAWHGAFWSSGAVLYVPRNVEIKAHIASVESLIPIVAAIATDGPMQIVQDDTFFPCGSGRLK